MEFVIKKLQSIPKKDKTRQLETRLGGRVGEVKMNFMKSEVRWENEQEHDLADTTTTVRGKTERQSDD